MARVQAQPAHEELLTPAEVAQAFRVDAKTVTRWAKAGKLSSIRTLGGHRRFRKAEVDALLRGETWEAETVRGWGVRYTHPTEGGNAVRPCKSLAHARAVLRGLPGGYRPARIVVGTGGSWAPYEDADGVS